MILNKRLYVFQVKTLRGLLHHKKYERTGMWTEFHEDDL
jgi:hypothetical protein